MRIRVRPADRRETRLTPVGGSCVQKRLKSQLTSGDGAPHWPCTGAQDAGGVPYGHGSRYR
ncbi:protein of unknown function [Streptomyces sp. KY75]|nr:protein of unknown function [Streptomyces sp. KY70]CAD5975835.1 protein of unknown function [Streptomyces sp. KY75]